MQNIFRIGFYTIIQLNLQNSSDFRISSCIREKKTDVASRAEAQRYVDSHAALCATRMSGFTASLRVRSLARLLTPARRPQAGYSRFAELSLFSGYLFFSAGRSRCFLPRYSQRVVAKRMRISPTVVAYVLTQCSPAFPHPASGRAALSGKETHLAVKKTKK